MKKMLVISTLSLGLFSTAAMADGLGGALGIGIDASGGASLGDTTASIGASADVGGNLATDNGSTGMLGVDAGLSADVDSNRTNIGADAGLDAGLAADVDASHDDLNARANANAAADAAVDAETDRLLRLRR